MELTIEQWNRLESLIPSPRNKHDGREVVPGKTSGMLSLPTLIETGTLVLLVAKLQKAYDSLGI